MADKAFLMQDGRGFTRRIRLIDNGDDTYAIATSTAPASETFLLDTGFGDRVPVGLVALGGDDYAISVAAA